MIGKGEIKKGIRYFQKAVKLGHVDSNFELSEYFFSEHRDLEQGVFYLNVAVEKGCQHAMLVLALNHLNGVDRHGFKWDIDAHRALYYLQILAQKNSREALLQLGKLYLEGKQVEQDLTKSINYLHRAVEFGNHYAHHYLGLVYEKRGEARLKKRQFALGAKYGIEESKAKMWGIFSEEIASEQEEEDQ